MAQPASFRRYCVCVQGSLLLGVLPSVVPCALLSGLLLTGGCDSESGKADKTLSAQLDDASGQMTGTEADRVTANHTLGDAARDNTASDPVQLRAKALLANSELQLAQGMVKQIAVNDVQIQRLVREIDLLSLQIDSNNRTIAAMAKHDPSALQDAVAQKKSDVTGSDSKPDWYKSDAGTLSSLTAVDSQLKDLQGKIAQLQDTIKSESDQRNQLLDQADKSSQQSQHEQGQKSVDLYTAGSTARKQAADLTVKIDNDNAQLASEQADLTVLQGQQDSLNSALKTFDSKSSAIDSDWKQVQAEQTELGEDSKKVLGDDPVNAPDFIKNGDLPTEETIGSKASAVFALAKKNLALRGNAESHFNSAIGKFGEAVSLATKIRSDLGDLSSKADPQRPDVIAWQQEQDAFDPSSFRFLQADAQLQAAEFYSASASEAKTRLDMMERIKPIIQQAKLSLLPTLDDSDSSVSDQMKKAQSSARDAYKNASDLLSKITDGVASADEKNGAQVQQIFAQYGLYLLEQTTGDPADAQDAPSHLGLARTAVTTAIADGTTLPSLPKDLIPAPAAAPGGMTAPGSTRFPVR
jgi:hypothetical protein